LGARGLFAAVETVGARLIVVRRRWGLKATLPRCLGVSVVADIHKYGPPGTKRGGPISLLPKNYLRR
jgi:hypothetical protein